MKVHLLQRDRDFEARPPANADALVQDLELDTLVAAMADGDAFLAETAKTVLLTSLVSPDEIRYRQAVLGDCIEHAAAAKELYAVTVETLERHKKVWTWMGSDHPGYVLSSAVDLLQISVEHLRRLRQLADQHAAEFRSEGFAAFFKTLQTELDDTYLLTLEQHLRQLRFRQGILESARLGRGSKGTEYVLRTPPRSKFSWRRLLRLGADRPMTIVIPPRDEAGARALQDLRERGLDAVANATARSADHVSRFFKNLRFELAFYLACLNVREHLMRKGEVVCFPEPTPPDTPVFTSRGLYEPCLSLRVPERVVGNDVAGDGKALIVITGANTGGKSTFLRSVGNAQLMMQSGMFVAAAEHRANVCTALFTHYRREEDEAMESGKLDEELRRMSEIADRITPGAVVLFNESFGATNEREGAEIAHGIVRALLESRMKVVFVTHSYELGDALVKDGRADALFLLAERRPDGTRTYRILPGEPLPTSYGEDLYRKIFEPEPRVSSEAAS